MATAIKYDKFVEDVLKMLVNNPKKVKVKKDVNERGVLLVVDLDPEDIGLVVGKKGQNINALRYITRVIGLRDKAYISIKLNQPEEK